MDQFKLVPQYFMEQFTCIVRQPLESFKAFVSRLTLLLDNNNVSIRDVIDLSTYCELLIADHVKSALSENSLSHVLRVETTRVNTWAKSDKLAETLDAY